MRGACPAKYFQHLSIHFRPVAKGQGSEHAGSIQRDRRPPRRRGHQHLPLLDRERCTDPPPRSRPGRIWAACRGARLKRLGVTRDQDLIALYETPLAPACPDRSLGSMGPKPTERSRPVHTHHRTRRVRMHHNAGRCIPARPTRTYRSQGDGTEPCPRPKHPQERGSWATHDDPHNPTQDPQPKGGRGAPIP